MRELVRSVRRSSERGHMLVAALLVTLAAPIAPSLASAQVAPSITAMADDTSIQAGGLTLVHGAVSPAGATHDVVLQRLIDGVWTDRSWISVNTDGSYGMWMTPYFAGTYTLRVRSAGGTVMSPEFTVESRPRPTRLTLDARRSPPTAPMQYGDVVQVLGTVLERDAVPTVDIQKEVGTRWVTIGTVPVNQRTGRFSYRFRAYQYGAVSLRARTPHGSKVSPTFALAILTP